MKLWFAAPAAILTLGIAGSALAEKPANTSALNGRILYICTDTVATRQAFAKEFGQVKFVTAADVRSGRETWVGPRCITPREHARLTTRGAT